ncbi:MAG: tape measure protein [Enterococcus casseliflavus]
MTASTEVITKSAAQMVSHVEISSTKAGKSIATSLESGSKDGAKTVSAAVDAMKKDLVSLADEAEKSGSKMSASFEQPTPKANILTGSVGKLSAAMLITKGATAALSMAKGSLDGAFGRIDTLNNFENTMTRLTGSSEEAAAGMEGVRDVVVGTNYMLDSAAQTVQRLVMQNGSLEQSTKSYQIWGDAVAMYGDGAAETMDNVMDAMIQMRATGTVNMAQMDRMVRRGVDPWKIYEDATGMSMQSIVMHYAMDRLRQTISSTPWNKPCAMVGMNLPRCPVWHNKPEILGRVICQYGHRYKPRNCEHYRIDG